MRWGRAGSGFLLDDVDGRPHVCEAHECKRRGQGRRWA